MISLNNIDMKSYKIKLSNFEVKKCFKDDDLYLIEYAALHSSLKIFKFLLMNESHFSEKLFQYAICGGNSEIIHLSENRLDISNENVEASLRLTVIYHHNELSNYLIENYNCYTRFKFLPLSIYHNNYNFFFNHFIDFDEEYNKLLNKVENQKINIDEFKKLGNFKKVIKESIISSAGSFCPIILKIVANIKKADSNSDVCIDAIIRGKLRPVAVTNTLFYAIQKFNNENAKFLFSSGSIDPNVSLFNGVAPFIWSCYLGNLEMVKYLSNNEKVNIKTVIRKSNENALLISTRMGNTDVVEYFVSLNVFDLSMKSINDETAIETAAKLGYKDIFNILKSQLIKDGVEINDKLAINDEKYYPLHYKKPSTIKKTFFKKLIWPECLIY